MIKDRDLSKTIAMTNLNHVGNTTHYFYSVSYNLPSSTMFSDHKQMSYPERLYIYESYSNVKNYQGRCA